MGRVGRGGEQSWGASGRPAPGALRPERVRALPRALASAVCFPVSVSLLLLVFFPPFPSGPSPSLRLPQLCSGFGFPAFPPSAQRLSPGSPPGTFPSKAPGSAQQDLELGGLGTALGMLRIVDLGRRGGNEHRLWIPEACSVLLGTRTLRPATPCSQALNGGSGSPPRGFERVCSPITCVRL